MLLLCLLVQTLPNIVSHLVTCKAFYSAQILLLPILLLGSTLLLTLLVLLLPLCCQGHILLIISTSRSTTLFKVSAMFKVIVEMILTMYLIAFQDIYELSCLSLKSYKVLDKLGMLFLIHSKGNGSQEVWLTTRAYKIIVFCLINKMTSEKWHFFYMYV